ncbi:MAG: DUF6263 family protein [Thermoguttaceae bacterium]
MKKLILPVFVLFVLALTVAQVRSEEKKYELKQGFPAGKYLMKMLMNSDMLMDAGVQAMPMQQEQTYEYAITAGEKSADGTQKVEMELTRLVMKMRAMGQEMEFDSQNQSADAANNPAFAMLRFLVGLKLTLTYDAEGKVTQFEGMDAFWDKVLETAPVEARGTIEQMKESMKPEALMGGLSQMQEQAMPKKPVTKGETWKNTLDLTIPMLGELKGEIDNTLKSVEDKEGVEVGTIEGKLVMDSAEGQKVNMGPVQMQFKDLKMVQESVTHIELATGLMTSATMTMEMKALLKMELPEGVEMEEAEIPEFKMDVKSNTHITVEPVK